ncbi:MAG: polysaccharide biosynthesis C-terminal domain-containing protein [Elusimicrobia bacterium]|nr:polysaccharide biosynthesis C-terminal domain-containing protein [Elusimicrobiota bacterium]
MPAIAAAQQRLGRNSVYAALGIGLPLCLAVFTVPATISGLGLERFGALSLFWVAVRWLAVPLLGFTRSLVKNTAAGTMEGPPHKTLDFARAGLLLQGAAAAAAAILSAALLPTLAAPVVPASLAAEFAAAIKFFPFFILLYMLANAVGAFFEARHDFAASALIRGSSESAFLLSALACAKTGQGLAEVLLLLSLCEAAVFSAALAAAFKAAPGLLSFQRPVIPLIREMTGFGAASVTYRFFLILGDELETVVLAALTPLAAVGAYSLPKKIVKAVSAVPSGVTLAAFPLFAQAAVSTDKNILRAQIRRVFAYTFFVSGTLYGTAGVFAPQLISAWAGESLSATAPLLRILALGGVFQSLAFVPVAALQSLDRHKRVALLQGLLTGAFAAACFPLVSLYGTTGAALAWTLKSFAAFCLMTLTLYRHRPAGGSVFSPQDVPDITPPLPIR